jgi:hypothetical protein
VLTFSIHLERSSDRGFAEGYWNALWGWYEHGGFASVAAYLARLDISTFDPKAPPPKTPAFWDIVDANRVPEDAELADVLDEMENPDGPDATTLIKITGGREQGNCGMAQGPQKPPSDTAPT